MKIVFFGTPDYVLPIIKTIHSPIVAVVTQSPKPVGRKKLLTYSPIDTWAYRKKIPIYFDPQKLIKDKIEADLGILAAYGEIIPKNVIEAFPYGILNIHPSLLPKYRGASPVQAAIVSDDKETGVTIIKLDEKLDHGPIISQFTEEILPDDITGSLRARLFERAAEVLVTMIPAYLAGKIKLRVQDDSAASYTTQLRKEHGFISPEYIVQALQGLSLQKQKEWKIPFLKDYSLVPSAYSLEHFIRAMDPWPIAWTNIRFTNDDLRLTKRLKILKAHLEPIRDHSREVSNVRLVVDLVQLEGKNPVSWKQFTEGYPSANFQAAK